MNTVSMNAVLLDGGTIIKTGDGGATINNQNKTVEIVENGSLSVVADSGYTGLGEVAINVNVPTSGGGGGAAPKSDVNFYDYDGTRLYSYTWDEAQAMTELPALPEREGLICQEWNYSLADIKAQNGKCDVGATYITDDGKTRIYLHIATEGRMTFPLCFSQSVANGVVIDWGDGSDTEVVQGTSNVKTSHTYASIGDYVITLAPNDGCTLNFDTSICEAESLNGSYAYHNMIQKVEIGANATSIGSNVFDNCVSLSSVAIPNGVTSIGDSAFNFCFSLPSVTIPNNVTSIGNYAFAHCFPLVSVAIPNKVTSIGDSAFNGCYSLPSVAIPNNVTSIGSKAFGACYSLYSFAIPNGVTGISKNAFNECFSLSSVAIPNGVTSIGDSAFSYCPSLPSVAIPNGVTSIGKSVFYYCPSLAICDFSTHTAVPSLGSNVFSSTPSDLKIIVPDALYDEWIAATNWSSYASQIVKASEV